MRHTPLLTASLLLTLAACAHSSEMQATTVTNEPAQPALEREVIAVDTTPTAEPAPPPGRPRLSQTITLGQGQEPQYTPAAPPAQAQAQAPTQNVVVNNNVIVQGTPGSYGYGGYHGTGGYGRPTTFSDGRSGSSRGTSPQWSSTGWEGARRTAAPGQTPGIGGNWSPAPSYGPAQMK